MSREIECPSCGTRIPLDDQPGSNEAGELPAIGEIGETVETVIPTTVCLDDDSRREFDGSAVSMAAHSDTEPFGIFVAGDGPGSSSGENGHVGSDSSDNGHDRSVSDPELHIEAVRNAAPAPEFDSGSSETLRAAAPDPVLDDLEAAKVQGAAHADSFLAQFSPSELRPRPKPLRWLSKSPHRPLPSRGRRPTRRSQRRVRRRWNMKVVHSARSS